MRIFVTGASGFVGSAIVKELLENDIKVLALARSEKSAQVLKSVGADVFMGDLNNLESLREGARSAEGVIHTAFNTAFTENDTFIKLRHNSEHDAVVMQANLVNVFML